MYVYHDVWMAMIRRLNPGLYPAASAAEDQRIIAGAGALLQRLKDRLTHFPDNEALRAWIGLIEGAR